MISKKLIKDMRKKIQPCKFKCKDCHECCDCPVLMTPAEWELIKSQIKKEGLQFPANNADYTCPLYSFDLKGCICYKNRPVVCRLFGCGTNMLECKKNREKGFMSDIEIFKILGKKYYKEIVPIPEIINHFNIDYIKRHAELVGPEKGKMVLDMLQI